MPSYQVFRLDTLAQLDAVEEEWTQLLSGIPGIPVFLTWEWIRTWWSFFGKNDQLWLLAARDQRGSLVGLAPWMRETNRIGLLKVRTIAFIGSNLVSPVHLNILARPTEQKMLLQLFLDYLRQQSDQWDAIRFDAVTQDSALNSLLAGNRTRDGEKVASLYIPLPGSWDQYSKTLTRKLRRNLKYFRSKLENDHPGEVMFTCVSDPGEANSVMSRLGELNKARRHDQGFSSAFDDPDFCGFHSAMARLALAKGWLRLYCLTVMGQVIAIFHCFRYQDHVYAYQIGFDSDWKGYSPGRLLIAHGIQKAIQEAACEFDWLAGEHDYKQAWTDQVRVENQILYGGSWRGVLWVNSKVFRRTLAAKAKQLLPEKAQRQLKQLLSPKQETPTGQMDKIEEGAGPTS